MSRIALVVVLVIAACSAEPPEVTVTVGAARWMAVRTTEEPDWRKVDGPIARIATDGDFEVAVVCREDIGDGWTWLATPGDIETNDDGVRELSAFCRVPEGQATVVFDVVGEVYGIYIGTQPTYGPTYYASTVVPGVYDVVAVRTDPASPGDAERVQIIRGVRVEAGMNRISIDVEALGQPVDTATVQVNGDTPDYVVHEGSTAGGTWFRLGSVFFEAAPLPVLPAALRVDGDRERAEIHLADDRWLTTDIHAGANDLTTDVPVVDGTFLIGGTTIQLSWPATDAYDHLTLSAWQVIGNAIERPTWTLAAYPGALANRTVDGTTTITMSAPDLAEFQPAWFTNFDAAYSRTANWWHRRGEGYEGFADSARISP